MIEEAYVSFETAKLLKEKGFDIICDKIYRIKDQYIVPLAYEMNLKGEGYYLCPTQQMAMRWLREVYGIIIVINYYMKDTNPECSGDGWLSEIVKYKRDRLLHHINGSIYYEDAVEAAIKYCLENLI